MGFPVSKLKNLSPRRRLALIRRRHHWLTRAFATLQPLDGLCLSLDVRLREDYK